MDKRCDIKAEIRRLLAEAEQMLGPCIELTAIEKSWGDTLNDRETLEWLLALVESESAVDRVEVRSEDYEVERREKLTKH